MPEDILDDSLENNDSENGYNHFILTEKATLYLYKAAQWARVLAVIMIIFSCYRFTDSFIRLSSTKSSIFSSTVQSRVEKYTIDFMTLIFTIFTIGANVFLFSFSNNFIRGYKLDNDNLIDKSLKGLYIFFKNSTIIIALLLLIPIVYILYSEISKYWILVIPVALLILFFYQNNTLDNDK